MSCDDGKRTETLETGRKAVIEIDYSVETPVKEVHARYMIYRIDGQLCSGSSTKIDRLDAFDLEKDGKIVIEFDSMTLTRSQYWVDIVLEKLMEHQLIIIKKQQGLMLYQELKIWVLQELSIHGRTVN